MHGLAVIIHMKGMLTLWFLMCACQNIICIPALYIANHSYLCDPSI